MTIQLILFLGGVASVAAAPVSITATIPSAGSDIPSDFVGMSWETRTLTRSHDLSSTVPGRRLFAPSDGELLTLFRNLRVRHLRVGGGSVDWPVRSPIPDRAGIDDLFAFVKAAGVDRVIYSFRLLESDPNVRYEDADAEAAKYIWGHHRDELDAFAVGNEPDRGATYRNDLEVRSLATYLPKWRRFAAAIHAAVPKAKFAGPDGGSGNVKWTVGFADAEKSSGLLAVITEHLYAGGAGRGLTPERGIDDMLSGPALKVYDHLYERMAVPVMADGFSYRFTEANDHYSGGVSGASNTFAGALWVLEFLHWWAAHGAIGVDVHNTDWVVNDSIHPASNGELLAGPKCYGIRAFSLGSQGRPGLATIENPQKVNLSVFAVGRSDHAFVTVINKEHGAGARDAEVTVSVNGLVPQNAAAIALLSPQGDVAATTGTTLGGGTINSHEPAHTTWSPITVRADGRVTLKVPAASAAVIRLRAL